MLLDPSERFVVSSLGWVDKGNIWILDISTGEVSTQSFGSASHLSLRAGAGDLFAVQHHFDDGSTRITAHSFSDPARILASCFIDHGRCTVDGDRTIWNQLPKHYVACLKGISTDEFSLISIQESGEAVIAQFDWYDDTYDKAYQGIVGVVAVPNTDRILVSVQRSSQIIICNQDGKKSGDFELAGSHGNPRLQFRRSGTELWADDYNTLLAIEPESWKVSRARRLQSADKGTAQFIGQYCFTADDQYCCVSRPYSGDVLLLDPNTLKARYRARLGMQPFEAVAMSDLKIIARDWQTGALLSGTASRAWCS